MSAPKVPEPGRMRTACARTAYLLGAFGGRNLSDEDVASMIRYVDAAVAECGGDAWCRRLLLDAVESVELEQKGRMQNAGIH